MVHPWKPLINNNLYENVFLSLFLEFYIDFSYFRQIRFNIVTIFYMVLISSFDYYNSIFSNFSLIIIVLVKYCYSMIQRLTPRQTFLQRSQVTLEKISVECGWIVTGEPHIASCRQILLNYYGLFNSLKLLNSLHLPFLIYDHVYSFILQSKWLSLTFFFVILEELV